MANSCTVVLTSPPPYFVNHFKFPFSSAAGIRTDFSQKYSSHLSTLLSFPSSELTISPALLLPPPIFGPRTSIPLKGTITYLDFPADILSISLAPSTKTALSAAYDHFLGSWPMRCVDGSVKAALKARFFRNIDVMTWEMGSEAVRAVDASGSGDFLEFHRKFQHLTLLRPPPPSIPVPAVQVGVRKKKKQKQKKSVQQLAPATPARDDVEEGTVIWGLGHMLGTVEERVRGLFLPALEEGRSIWAIEYVVPKEHREKFIPATESIRNLKVEEPEQECWPQTSWATEKRPTPSDVPSDNTPTATLTPVMNPLPKGPSISRTKRKRVTPTPQPLKDMMARGFRPANIAETSAGGKIRLSSVPATAKPPQCSQALPGLKEANNNTRRTPYPTPDRSVRNSPKLPVSSRVATEGEDPDSADHYDIKKRLVNFYLLRHQFSKENNVETAYPGLRAQTSSEHKYSRFHYDDLSSPSTAIPIRNTEKSSSMLLSPPSSIICEGEDEEDGEYGNPQTAVQTMRRTAQSQIEGSLLRPPVSGGKWIPGYSPVAVRELYI